MAYEPTPKEYQGFLDHVDQIEPMARRHAPDSFDPYVLGEPPRLENWRIAYLPDFKCEVLVGAVIGHPHLGDRPLMHTSALVWIDEELGYARSVMRVYSLGTPRHDA